MSQQENIPKVVAALPNVWKADAHVEWSVDEMFPTGSVNLLSAESGTSKTWVAYAVAGAVSRGEPFIGLPVKQRPVLYMDGENPLGVVKERLGNLAIPAEGCPGTILITPRELRARDHASARKSR